MAFDAAGKSDGCFFKVKIRQLNAGIILGPNISMGPRGFHGNTLCIA
jgi:hypothetical protein